MDCSNLQLARTLASSSLDTFKWMGEIGLNASYGAEANYGEPREQVLYLVPCGQELTALCQS